MTWTVTSMRVSILTPSIASGSPQCERGSIDDFMKGDCMANLYAKVIEDNGGGLHLYVMDSTDTCIYAHYGYEYRPGALTEDIKALIETDSVTDWEGYEENVAEEWEKLDIECTSRNIVADVTDSKLTLFPEKMGRAAQLELKIEN